ncbi:MAG TPA: hypothetical protein VGK96_01970 [Candidatus Sulfotelmatobacter sp.]
MFLTSERRVVLSNSTGTRRHSSKLIASIAVLLVSLIAGSQVGKATTIAGGYDGPAALPRVLIPTAMTNTPTPGITITVNSGESLQAALNRARCGDTIHLQAGATFTGQFTFPAKSCDASHWIVVRTSADNSTLPAEGNRLTPCYAGVTYLPGRPALHCISTKNVLAKLVMPTTGSGPVLFASGANHYRLMGLEITRAATAGLVYGLAATVGGGTMNNVILDRVWMHGTAQADTTRGVWLGGGTYVSIIDSFLTDFHCVSLTGACGDSQAIAGGIGKGPMGPYKITNNFLEAAGENILFGGGAASATPTDIQVSQNHMFKPMTWMKGQPGYVGGANGNPFSVKNLFELKNAQRVLLENNIMENTWGGFSEVGYAILLTPKNQSSLCPICQVTDITIRYNYTSHMGAGIQLANGRADNGALPLNGGRYSIHDDVFDDINGTIYHGPGFFAQVSTDPGVTILHDVTINHVTAFAPKTLLLVGDVLSTNTPMSNFVFTNNIVNAGAAPVWSTGTDGFLNCAVHDSPIITLTACFSSHIFSNNAVVAIPSIAPVSTWPTHNFFPTTATAVEFVNYNGGSGGNYQLQSSSPYKAAGTDGKNLGADIPGVNAAIARVR